MYFSRWTMEPSGWLLVQGPGLKFIKLMRVGRRSLGILLPLRYCLLTFRKVYVFSVPNPSKSFWDVNIPEAPSACSFAKLSSRKRQAGTLSSLGACLPNMGQIPRLSESRAGPVSLQVPWITIWLHSGEGSQGVATIQILVYTLNFLNQMDSGPGQKGVALSHGPKAWACYNTLAFSQGRVNRWILV